MQKYEVTLRNRENPAELYADSMHVEDGIIHFVVNNEETVAVAPVDSVILVKRADA